MHWVVSGAVGEAKYAGDGIEGEGAQVPHQRRRMIPSRRARVQAQRQRPQTRPRPAKVHMYVENSCTRSRGNPRTVTVSEPKQSASTIFTARVASKSAGHQVPAGQRRRHAPWAATPRKLSAPHDSVGTRAMPVAFGGRTNMTATTCHVVLTAKAAKMFRVWCR